MLRIRARGPCVMALAAVLYPAAPPAQAHRSAPQQRRDLTTAEWRADLRHFAEQMPTAHLNLFHTMSPQAFAEAVAALDRRLPELADHEIIVELARITSMVRDGHTTLWLTPNDQNGFHQVPILLYWLQDGLYVLGVEERHRAAVGGRVVRIGNVSATEAMERVSDLVPRDNEWGVASITPRYLAIPEVLHAVRITDRQERVTYVIEDDRGRRHEIELEAIPDAFLSNLSSRPFVLTTPNDRVRLVLANEVAGEAPLYLSNPGTLYWYQFLPESNTMYVQHNGIRDAPDETMAAFYDRVFAEVDRRAVDRLVIDLRLNGGGNNMLNLPVVHGIVRREELDRHGKVFVIVSRHTFSAASHLVTYLERHTNALFVGEPTGASPNHYGDARPVVLPNSGLRVAASTIYWQNSLPQPFETRATTSPDLAAGLTIDDFRANRDPALRVILSYEPTEPLTTRMEAALRRDGVGSALAVYHAFRADPRFAYADTENDINALGYRVLRDGFPGDAVAIFRLNVEAYPSSANVHDSLGDGLLAAGDTAQAIASYRQALRVDPTFAPSRANIERLTGR